MSKHVSTFLFILVFHFSSFSQVNYGLKFGASQSSTTSYKNLDDNNYIGGLQIGAFADYEVLKNFNFRPGLQFTQKGHNVTSGGPLMGLDFSERLRLNYLEMPLDFVYNISLSHAIKLFFGAGPSLGFGFSGNQKSFSEISDASGRIITTSIDSDEVFGNNRPYKRFDVGANFTFGFQYKKIMLSSNYNHGLINTSINSAPGLDSRNRSFGLSLGYFFNRR